MEKNNSETSGSLIVKLATRLFLLHPDNPQADLDTARMLAGQFMLNSELKGAGIEPLNPAQLEGLEVLTPEQEAYLFQ